MTNIKFKVLGKPWSLRLMSKRSFNKKHGKETLAVTLTHRKRIDVSPKGCDLETIIHELFHAYKCEMCVNATYKIDLEDQEEFYAELVSKRGLELIELGGTLVTKLADKLESMEFKNAS